MQLELLGVRMKHIDKMKIAIEVIEEQINLIEQSRKGEPSQTIWYDQLFQLRNGKAYMENVLPFLYGTQELIKMDLECYE